MDKDEQLPSGAPTDRDARGRFLKGNGLGLRFGAGQKANTIGNIPRDTCVTSLVKAMLDLPANYVPPGMEDMDGLKTWRQLIAKCILIGAAERRPLMVRELLDRLEGKVPLPVQPVGGGDPIVFRVVYGSEAEDKPVVRSNDG